MKKIIPFIAFLAFISLIIYFINLNTGNNNCITMPAKEMNLIEHKNMALHNHLKIKISILGQEQNISNHIGLSNGVMRPLHTHDASGRIHIESPCQREFKLKDFFDIWEKSFNSTCIFNFCTDETHTLSLYVNGIQDYEFENLVLKGDDLIEVIYK